MQRLEVITPHIAFFPPPPFRQFTSLLPLRQQRKEVQRRSGLAPVLVYAPRADGFYFVAKTSES